MSLGIDGTGHATGAPDLLPHGVCYLWDPSLIYLHVSSDTVIALSYFSIPAVLMILGRRRPDLIPTWILHLFSAFILLCGLTHVMGIWTLWNPDFLAQGMVKSATAAVSAITAITLWPILPKLLSTPSHEQLAGVNRELKAEVRRREHAERDAETQRKLMEVVLDNVQDAIVACDAEGRLSYFNRATQRVHGLPAEPLHPECWAEHYDLYHADGKTPLEMEEIPLFRALKGEAVDDVEMVIKPKTGDPVTMIAKGRPMYGSEGKKLGAVVSMFDITERKKTDQALAESQEQLRHAQKVEALGQLPGGVAHDFNNLLTVVLGNLQLIKRRLNGDERMHEWVNSAILSSQRGAELTRRLLAFARRQVLEPEVVDLNQLIPEMRGILYRTVEESVEISFAYGRNLWRTRVDCAQLETSLLNLVINSRDALPEGGTVTVETENVTFDEQEAALHSGIKPGDYVMLAVSDNGTGMSREIRERVYEPFFTTKSKGQGTGLGLSMVHGFVHQSGGYLSIYSEPGRGTVVKLYLPRCVEALAASDGPRTTSAGVKPSERTILVVEDDQGVREVAVALLSEMGYRVLSADGGPEALELAEENPHIDLLFTDVVMPHGMDGPRVAKLLKQKLPGLRVLFTSGYTANALTNTGEMPAQTDLLDKPYSNEALEAKIAAVLAR